MIFDDIIVVSGTLMQRFQMIGEKLEAAIA